MAHKQTNIFKCDFCGVEQDNGQNSDIPRGWLYVYLKYENEKTKQDGGRYLETYLSCKTHVDGGDLKSMQQGRLFLAKKLLQFMGVWKE